MDDTVIGNFLFHKISLADAWLIEARSFEDVRGYFMELYKEPDFQAAGINARFIQDNLSVSTKGVLRGLHYQVAYPQAKLVQVVQGAVFDVGVDLRKGSPSYGKWEGVLLSDSNRQRFFLPRGFAHGFLVLSDSATVVYKCDEIYHPEDEQGIRWDDPFLAIDWPQVDAALTISVKDAAYALINERPDAIYLNG